MRQALALIVAVLILKDAAAGEAEKPKFEQYRAKLTGGRVHVRAGPGQNHTSLAVVQTGDTVFVVGVQGAWARIDAPEGCEVFIAKELVKLAGKSGTVTADHANIRAKPSEKGDIMGQVDKGASLEVLATEGKWLKIRPPKGITAWISAKYLEPPPPGATVEK